VRFCCAAFTRARHATRTRSRACIRAPQASAAKTLAAGASAASSSPIQRTITGNDAFTVLQTVRLTGDDPRVDQARACCARYTLGSPGMTHDVIASRFSRIAQVVRFGSVGELRLSAGASTPAASRRRIDFAFESGFFDFKAFPLRIPCACTSTFSRVCVLACGRVCASSRLLRAC
jgi:hypothetical protein